MQTETKPCKNCQQNFIIVPEDFSFYKKMDVPAPTLCPQCRMQRRMLFFNERALFKRKCGLCGKESVSSHRPDAPHPVYCQTCWWSDKWDPLVFGREYDPSRSFFEQLKELRDAVPLPSLNNIHTTNINSEYCNMTSYVKNSYLLFNSDFDEECSFGCYLEQSKRCYDVDDSDLCELCYDSVGLHKCYRVQYSVDLVECIDALFSRSLHNCSDCFGSINLRNKQYCIFNEQKTKEEYFAELKKFDLTTAEQVQELKERVEKFFLTQPRKYMTSLNTVNSTGDYIFQSKNITKGYNIVGAEDCKYCHFFIIKGGRDCMDVTKWGGNLVRGYESCAIGGGQNNVKFCFECWAESSNLTYCSRIVAPNSDLFGCIGLRNKQYCVLNKQYSKEEYGALTTKIIARMREDGEWGEFFPASYSLFGYNESFANKFLPLSKTEIEQKGFKWAEPEQRTYEVGGDVLACGHTGQCDQQCSTAFRLTSAETAFYKNYGIALPTLCPNCRHYERLRLRNGIELFHRKCMCDRAHASHAGGHCRNEFETSYAPDRPEIVYCEQCYQAEVT